MILKTSLQIFFLLNVIVCYCMLHNLILNGRDININDSIGNWKWLARGPRWKEEGWITKWKHWCWNLAKTFVGWWNFKNYTKNINENIFWEL
jgi:hypothetical protein